MSLNNYIYTPNDICYIIIELHRASISSIKKTVNSNILKLILSVLNQCILRQIISKILYLSGNFFLKY